MKCIEELLSDRTQAIYEIILVYENKLLVESTSGFISFLKSDQMYGCD